MKIRVYQTSFFEYALIAQALRSLGENDINFFPVFEILDTTPITSKNFPRGIRNLQSLKWLHDDFADNKGYHTANFRTPIFNCVWELQQIRCTFEFKCNLTPTKENEHFIKEFLKSLGKYTIRRPLETGGSIFEREDGTRGVELYGLSHNVNKFIPESSILHKRKRKSKGKMFPEAPPDPLQLKLVFRRLDKYVKFIRNTDFTDEYRVSMLSSLLLCEICENDNFPDFKKTDAPLGKFLSYFKDNLCYKENRDED